jgi:hypothetical protein
VRAALLFAQIQDLVAYANPFRTLAGQASASGQFRGLSWLVRSDLRDLYLLNSIALPSDFLSQASNFLNPPRVQPAVMEAV